MSSLSDSLTLQQLQEYRSNKTKLVQALKTDSDDLQGRANASGKVGLRNQGATCYLNSLLQGLFNTTPFRQRLYQWQYDAALHGDEARCIPLQLQRVFARLQLSKRPAVSTKALTASFGWTSSDAFQQHDVQEMLLVLLDALDRSLALAPDANVTADGTPLPSFADILSGRVRDGIRCLECGNARSHSTPFVDLDVPLPGADNASVTQALQAFFAEEVLGAGDAWACDKCGIRGGAKQASLESLPPLLMLHLKRFSFDFRIMRRVKLHTALNIEKEVDMAPFLATSDTHTPQPDLRYELYGIMIHMGSAMGGHYFAYINPGEGGVEGEGGWHEFNDAGVKALSEHEVGTIFAEGGTAPAETTAAEAPQHDTQPGTKADTHTGETAGRDTSKPGVITIGVDAADKQQAATARAGGARSNAYMLLYRRAGAKTLADLASQTAGSSTPPSVAALPPPAVLEEVTADNAFFQEMSQLHAISRLVTTVHVFPPSATADAKKAHQRLTAAAAPEAAVPQAGGQRPDTASSSQSRPGTASSGRPGTAGSRPSSAVPGVRPGTASSAARDATTAALDWEGLTQELCSLDVPSAWSMQRVQQEVLSFTLPLVAAGEYDVSPADDHTVGADAAAGVSSLRSAAASALLAVPSDCLRLRRFIPSVGRCMDTYSGKRLESSMRELNLFPSAKLVLETKEEHAEWEQYNPNEMAVTAVASFHILAACVEAGVDVDALMQPDAESKPLATTVDAWELARQLALAVNKHGVQVKVEGEKTATVGNLVAALRSTEEAPWPLGSPLLLTQLRMTGDAAAGHAGGFQGIHAIAGSEDEEVTLQQHLQRDHGIFVGDVVVVEPVVPVGGDHAPASRPSAVRAALVASASTISLQYNPVVIPEDLSSWDISADVASPPDHSQCIAARSNEALIDVKARIAHELGICVDAFHIRRSVRAPQVKDESVSLQEMGLVDSSPLHLCPGPPLPPDQIMLKVYHFKADPKPAFKLLCKLPAAEDASVLSIKRMISDVLASKKAEKRAAEASAAGEAAPTGKVPVLPAGRIRLRDRKGKEVGAVFRDSQPLKAALKGRMEDGRGVAFQVLPEPETVGPTDMIVAVRQWRPLLHGDAALSPAVEVVLPKRITVMELGQLVRTRGTAWFPASASAGGVAKTAAEGVDGGAPPSEQEGLICYAKSTVHGVPLSASSAGQLKWLPELELELDRSVTHQPLGLRDGTTLVVRTEAHFEAATAAGKFRKAAAAKGKGKRAGGPAKPWARKGGAGGVRPKEKAISIEVSVAVPGQGTIVIDNGTDGSAPMVSVKQPSPSPAPAPAAAPPGSSQPPPSPMQAAREPEVSL